MKKNYILSAFILLQSVFNISYAQNLIPNPSWELGPNVSTNYVTGWVVNGPDLWMATLYSPDRIVAGSTAAFRDNDPAHHGAAYVMYYGPTSEAGICTLTAPIVAGTTYQLSYWLDVDDNFDGGPGAIKFRFAAGDSITSPMVTNTGSWQFFSTFYTATMPATELELIGVGGNLTKIDNISLTEDVTALNQLSTTDNTFTIYPNPATS